MFIVLAGEVAIYKLRDQEEVMKEEAFHAAANKLLNGPLFDHLEAYGYVSRELIDEHFEDHQREQFKDLPYIEASKIGLPSARY